MSNEWTWPRVRALLDEAVQSENGIAISYPDWSCADRVRANAYKIRDLYRRESKKTFPNPEEPGHGVSSYDGLVFWIKSSILRSEIEVEWIDADEEIATAATQELLSEIPGKRAEPLAIAPKTRVNVRYKNLVIRNAPDFKTAWSILRADAPCELIIENGYSLKNLQIRQL